jgi:hypothetical protein
VLEVSNPQSKRSSTSATENETQIDETQIQAPTSPLIPVRSHTRLKVVTVRNRRAVVFGKAEYATSEEHDTPHVLGSFEPAVSGRSSGTETTCTL